MNTMMKRMTVLLLDLGNISIHRHQLLSSLNRYPSGYNSLVLLLKDFLSNQGSMKLCLDRELIQLEPSPQQQELNQLNKVLFRHHS